MIRRIKTPHLPDAKVKHIIIGEKYRNLLENALFEHDLSPIWLVNDPFVDERLCGHADLSAAMLGNTLLCAEYLRDCECINKVAELGFDIRFVDNPGKTYPGDAKLNFCVIGSRLIYNPKTAVNISANDYHRIPVRQGYTKCSVCIVNENSVITSDSSIAKALAADGMDVLYIDKPFVSLEGFDRGFIGGAAFKISKDELAFTGVINDKEIKRQIESFLDRKAVKPVYLTEHTIFDIGSAIPLTEE